MGIKMDARQYIRIRGANENNLKNIDVDIPRNELVVLTGLSGSGKSSLAFDTIYAEGQRRYMESLSSYARQFLGQMEKPDVESIEGLSPAISIDQKSTNHNPRSTVGTVTEIYDYFRLLYARVGIPHCPKCGREIMKQTVDQMVDQIMALPERTRIQLLAPVVRGRKGTHAKLLERLLSQDLLQLIDDKPANLDSVLEALSQSDIPLDELKRLGRELFESFRGPLSWKLLWPRKRKVRLGSSPTKLHPLDGLFIRCGSLTLPVFAEEALALPDHVLNELGLFEVLYEAGDSAIRRQICQKQQVPPHVREKLATDPDLSVRLLAGTALNRHYQSMMVREDLLFFWPAPCETQVFRLSREGKNWTFRTDGQSGDYGLHKVFSLLDESSDEQTASFIRAAALSEDPFMRGAAACATLQKETASRLAHDADPLVRRALLQNIRSMLQIDADDLIFAVGRDPDLVRTALLMLEVAERLGLACDAGEKRLVLQNSVGELPGMRPLDAEMASSMSEFFHHFLGETQARAVRL